MLIRYYKGEPNYFLIGYRDGAAKSYGVGKSLWYTPFNTSLAKVPVTSRNAPFIFKEATANFQEVTIQGQLTYRLTDPEQAAQFLDFTIDSDNDRYKSEDPDALTQRITNTVQGYTRNGVSALSLENALTQVKTLASAVLQNMNEDADIKRLGVIIETLHFTTVSATPEMRKALEANYREKLQKRADMAIYDRRANALEEERKLKESEMSTDIEIEAQRKELVTTQAQNSLTLAEAEAKADEMKLNPYSSMPPQALVGLALKEWAANAGDIGTLNLSADMLSQLVSWVGKQDKIKSDD